MLAYIGLQILDGLPRTLQFEIDRWDNSSWGLHNIERQKIRCEVAVASDGSRSNHCEQESFHHFFIRHRKFTDHTVYLRKENAGFRIDHKARTVRGGPCQCTWPSPARLLLDDRECTRTVAKWLPASTRSGTGQVAGHYVIHFQKTHENGGETRLSVAPDLACEVMEEASTSPGTFGIPSGKSSYRVTAYKPGEPDPNLFGIPNYPRN